MNEALKFKTKLMVTMSILSIVILCAGPLGYKSGALPLQPAMVTLIVSLGIAVVTLILSLILFALGKDKGFSQNRKFLLIALLISLVPSLFVGMQLKTAASVPEIHDISTDTFNPPVFDAIVMLRKDAPNSLVYEYRGSAEKLAALQIAAYPDLKPLTSILPVNLAIERTVGILKNQGLDVINVNAANGTIEATATSFWYGFKDDVVVRIQATEQGTRVDLRSVSRVGLSDVGANAARIRLFSKEFKALE
ncbi:MAG: hypothetical protein ACI84K_000687 [Pseudohongiellaceae bacterium]